MPSRADEAARRGFSNGLGRGLPHPHVVRALFCVVWAASVVAQVPAPSEAPPPVPGAYALRWDAPATCPTHDQLRAAIATLLGREPSGQGTIHVDARVTPTPRGVRLTLHSEFSGVVDERAFEGAACQEVADAAVLFLVLALEPGFTGAPSGATPPPAGLSESATVPPPPRAPTDGLPPAPMRVNAAHDPPARTAPLREPPRAPTRREPRAPADVAPPPWRASDARRPTAPPVPTVRLGVGPEYGTLTAWTLAATASVSAAWPRWSLQIDGRYLAPRRLPATGPGALYQFGGLSTRGCARLPGGPVEIPVCLGVMVGLVRGASRGLLEPRVEHGLWVGPVLSAGLAGRPGLARWWVALDLGVTAYAARFAIDDAIALAPAPVNLSLTGGVEFGAPRWRRWR